MLRHAKIILVSVVSSFQLSPLYQAALQALSLLDYHALDELKSYSHPPEGVKDVANMLCVLFDVEQWSVL